MAFVIHTLRLRQFGTDIYVASLVALAMASEPCSIMTAIVVAGRSGYSYAAYYNNKKKLRDEIYFDPL